MTRRLIPLRIAPLLIAAGLHLAGCQDASLTGSPPRPPIATPSTMTKTAPGGCTVTVRSGLQSAVDEADPGGVVCVEPGTYDGSLTIDVENLTVRSTEYRGAVIDGEGTASAVTIEADGVTVERFEVTNPDGLLGIKVGRGHDAVTIRRNVVTDVGPTGRLGVTGILVGQGDHDEITIANNVVQSLDQETTAESRFPTVNGILFDADNDDPGTIANVTVNNNTIRDLESDVAPLGLVLQHETDGVVVNNNRIRGLTAADDTDADPSDGVDFPFTFAQGINIASPSTAETVVNHNVIEAVTSAETIRPEAVKIDGDGGGVKFRANQFLVAIGLNNRNGTDDGQRDPSGDPVVDAKNNWWGRRSGPEEAAFNQAADDDGRSDVVGNVDAEPFLRNPPGKPGAGRP